MPARVVLLLLALSSLCAAGTDTKKVREVLTAILSERHPARRAKLAQSLTGPVDEIEAAVRKGPLYPAGIPEARTVRGKKEKLSKFGNVVVGYSFEVGGAVYRYAVDVPRKYSPRQAHAILLDPGHGTGAKLDDKGKADFLPFYRGHADRAGGRDWLVVRSEIVEQIGADGLRGSKPEDYGARVFQELFRDLATRFHIDPDKIYVSGLSQTGFWAWYLGCARADRFAGIAPMSAVTWQADPYPANFLNLPVYVLHGAQDPVCPVGQPRATLPVLARIGVPVKYVEIATGAHDGRVWGQLSQALKWLDAQPRKRYPRRVSKSLQTVLDGWCYWLRVDELRREGSGKANEGPTGGIDGEIDGQTVRLFSEGVKKVTLCLASEMLDLGKPVRVEWNGKPVFEGRVEPSVETLLEIAYDKTDWRATFEAALALAAP